jgi:hypothetical protein
MNRRQTNLFFKLTIFPLLFSFLACERRKFELAEPRPQVKSYDLLHEVPNYVNNSFKPSLNYPGEREVK